MVPYLKSEQVNIDSRKRDVFAAEPEAWHIRPPPNSPFGILKPNIDCDV